MSVKVTADGTLGLYQETIGVASAALNVNSDVPVTVASPLTATGALTATAAPVYLRNIEELTTPITGAGSGGDVTHDTSLAHIFVHSSIAANFTADLTNLNLTSGYATTVTLVLQQGAIGYYPNVLKIAGSAKTINWQGNVLPVPTANRTDIVTFSIILSGPSTYLVYGQLTSF
jgi:hypothetical protein